MSDKEKEDVEEIKEGEIDAAILDDAFDDHHGFGDDEQEESILPKDVNSDDDDPTPEWRSDDQPDNW